METDFATRRAQAVKRWFYKGVKVLEPDTVWGTGPGNVPAVNGLANLYFFGEYVDGEWKPNRVELPGPRDLHYMATKYGDELGERIHELIGMGDWDDDIGSVDELGWYAKAELDVDSLLRLGIIQFAEELDRKLPIAVIIDCDDRGFCGYGLFFEGEEELYEQQWNSIVESYHEYWNQEDDDDAED